MPPTLPLFDAAFQACQKARAAAWSNEPPPAFVREAEARLRERLEDLKTPPPDIALSCLALQNENDLPAALRTIHSNLAENGLFHAVMLGGESLRELCLSLAEAETALTGGTSPRVAPMIDLETAGRLMLDTGFFQPVVDSERLTLIYPDLFALMRDLRRAGFANALSARSRRFAPRALFTKTAEIYVARFPGPKGGIAVTMDLIFLHGWKKGFLPPNAGC